MLFATCLPGQSDLPSRPPGIPANVLLICVQQRLGRALHKVGVKSHRHRELISELLEEVALSQASDNRLHHPLLLILTWPVVLEPPTQQWMNNHFRLTAFDYGLNLDETQSFYRGFIEAWLLQGRFPCGWKGRPHPEPKARYSISPSENITVQELAGDGQLIVY